MDGQDHILSQADVLTKKAISLEANVGLTSNFKPGCNFKIFRRSFIFGKGPLNQLRRIHLRVHLGVHGSPGGSPGTYYITRILS